MEKPISWKNPPFTRFYYAVVCCSMFYTIYTASATAAAPYSSSINVDWKNGHFRSAIFRLFEDAKQLFHRLWERGSHLQKWGRQNIVCFLDLAFEIKKFVCLFRAELELSTPMRTWIKMMMMMMMMQQKHLAEHTQCLSPSLSSPPSYNLSFV